MMVTRDERLVALASRWFDLDDLLSLRKRMIGTGLIGGKSVGMLLARAILCKTDPRWRDRLETHDSFYIGSDVFYTFLVRNGCWRARRGQRNADTFMDGADVARERILSGTFPGFLQEQFVAMLEYFGQSPIIVRSSSLLEDSFGNAFTGKYDSVFCPNQGSPQERLEAFLSAVRTVYASTMSPEALLYRAHRGLIDRDEQMAILVQRVSGAVHGHLFYPQVAGVGLSYNPYVWSEQIDPEAGVLRLVFGLGTRAVDRSDDDYTRLVALNAPQRRPDAERSGSPAVSQRRVDLLDLRANRFTSERFDEVARTSPDLPIDLYAVRRSALLRGEGDSPRPSGEGWVLTFGKLLSETPFVPYLREMLGILRDAYEYPVDAEFTANFLPDGRCLVNLVQCRPLQVKEGGNIVDPPKRIPRSALLLESRGPVIGQSSLSRLDRMIFVDPAAYSALPQRDRPSVGRLIGRIVHHPAEGGPEHPAAGARTLGDEHAVPRSAGLVRRDRQGVRDLRDHRGGDARGPRHVARDALFQRPGRGEHAVPCGPPDAARGFPEPDVPRGGFEPPRRTAPGGCGVGGGRARHRFPGCGRRAGSVPERQLLPPARRLLPGVRGERIVIFGCAPRLPTVGVPQGAHFVREWGVASEGGAPFVARRAMNLHGCAPRSSYSGGTPGSAFRPGVGRFTSLRPPSCGDSAGPSPRVLLPCCLPDTLPYL